jgi:hypothetical protein
MRVLKSLLLLTLIASGLGVVNAQADDVYFRGTKLTRQHAIFGTVISTGSRLTIVNIGYAHGVLEGTEFFICRLDGESLVPVNKFFVEKVTPATCQGTTGSYYKVQRGDFAVIPAGHLNLWKAESRLSRVVVSRRVRSLRVNGYDQRELSGGLAVDLARDDAHVELSIPEKSWGAIAIDSLHLRAQAIAKAKLASGQATADDADPGEGDEFIHRTPERQQEIGKLGIALADFYDAVLFDSLPPESTVRRSDFVVGNDRQRIERELNEHGLRTSFKRIFGIKK